MTSLQVYKLCGCGDEVEPRRWALGYRECLRCGEIRARVVAARMKQCMAPAFNKGAYQPVMSRADALLIGRK